MKLGHLKYYMSTAPQFIPVLFEDSIKEAE